MSLLTTNVPLVLIVVFGPGGGGGVTVTVTVWVTGGTVDVTVVADVVRPSATREDDHDSGDRS